MNFIEITDESGSRKFELQVEVKIPCSEEEKRIYKVNTKFPEGIILPYVCECNFSDGGIFYYASEHYYHHYPFPCPFSVPFLSLEKAKEFVVNQAMKAGLKFL